MTIFFDKIRYRRIRDDSDSFVNKYLNKSRQASVAPESASGSSASASANSNSTEHSGIPTKKISDPGSNNSRSRYAALRDRRSRVARSKSSAVLGLGHQYDDDDDDDDEDDEDDSVQTPFTSRFGRELAKSRSSHFLKSQPSGDDSDSGLPSSSAAMTSDDDNLSTWARYLKNKYGSKTRKSSNKEEQNKNEINSNNYGPGGSTNSVSLDLNEFSIASWISVSCELLLKILSFCTQKNLTCFGGSASCLNLVEVYFR